MTQPTSHETHMKSLDGSAVKCPEDKKLSLLSSMRLCGAPVLSPSSAWTWAPPPTSLRGMEAWHDFGPDPGPYLDVLFGACGDQMFLVITPPPIRPPVSSKINLMRQCLMSTAPPCPWYKDAVCVRAHRAKLPQALFRDGTWAPLSLGGG